ncbi:hypothetical protein V8C86DRAFT_2556949 [Haematococcus lacustris]
MGKTLDVLYCGQAAAAGFALTQLWGGLSLGLLLAALFATPFAVAQQAIVPALLVRTLCGRSFGSGAAAADWLALNHIFITVGAAQGLILRCLKLLLDFCLIVIIVVLARFYLDALTALLLLFIPSLC